MSIDKIDESIRTAAISLEIEGKRVDSQYVEWCRQMLFGEIAMEEYIALVIGKVRDS